MDVAEGDLQLRELKLFQQIIDLPDPEAHVRKHVGQLVGWVERSDTHHLLPLSKNPAIMRDIACPILGIDAELHHAME